MKKGRKLLIPVILAAVAAYNMYIYTDGSSVLKNTNLRESDSTEADSFYRTAHTYDKGESAITKVYHSPSLQCHYHPEGYDGTDIPETGAVYNSGILCYNSEKNMFVAMEFSPEYVDDRLLRSLAASTEIK